MLRLTIILLALVLALDPARAGGGGEAKPAPVPGQHPDAAAVNARNPAVIHAGPGAPMVGTVHVSPSAAAEAEKAKKKH